MRGFFERIKNGLDPKNIWAKTKKSFKRIKTSLIPKNIWIKINNMAKMDQVYWSKVLIAVVSGMIFGFTNFTKWPATTTMLIIFLALSGTWALVLRKKEPGIKLRSYFTSAIFQYFISFVAIWTLVWTLMHVPDSNWLY